MAGWELCRFVVVEEEDDGWSSASVGWVEEYAVADLHAA